MSIKISRESEAWLAGEAKRLGISVEALLETFIEERTTLNKAAEKPQLPRWHLGAAGAFHRRDIYDDVR